MKKMRLWIVVPSLVLVTSGSGLFVEGQGPGFVKRKTQDRKNAPPEIFAKKQRHPELLALIADVRSAPPEFAADMLITIAESEQVADIEWKKELLDEAFHVASGAQYRMAQVAVGPYPIDTRAGYLSEAFKLKLDTLSLQCRAVGSMIRLDRVKARQLFSETGSLKFAALSCSDGLAYEVSDYYTTAAKLAQEGFSAREMRRDEHIRFLESLVSELSSPVQVAPVANVIRSIKASRPQREMLLAAFASALTKTSGDDRSFSSSLYAAGQEIAKLQDACKDQGIPTSELIAALRAYYVRHFSASRCSDTLRHPGDSGRMPPEVNDFNNRLRALSEKNISEIDADEVKPSRVEGAVDVHFYGRSPRAAEIINSFKRLKFGAGRTPLTPAETDTDQWRSDLGEFLTRLSAWEKDERESEEDYFHQKCNLFQAVLTSLPPWPGRDDVRMQFIAFVSDFDLKRGSRIEWFWHAKTLLEDLDRIRAETRAKVIGQLESSKNPVLYLYAQMRKTLAGRTEPRV
ncbi:MAG TPA: hypothetical protein VJH03_17985 [Blastocatellia bacterium]|nr:hypothetical protein [Blastocatellia bacterium]